MGVLADQLNQAAARVIAISESIEDLKRQRENKNNRIDELTNQRKNKNDRIDELNAWINSHPGPNFRDARAERRAQIDTLRNEIVKVPKSATPCLFPSCG